MSVAVMSMVFERYPNGGGEMLLALALADHAHSDGTHVHPGLRLLAYKTRQSERAVQYQLRRMEKSGWLILVNSGNGGRNQPREYRINPAWIKGEEIAPVESAAKGEEIAPTENEKGAADDTKGCNSEQERVQSTTLKGAKLLHPHITISEPSVEPPLEPVGGAIPSASVDQLSPPTRNPNGTFAVSIDWRPSDKFGDLLAFAGLANYPWEDDLPEFVLYRLGQGEQLSQGGWEHRFIQTIKRNAAYRMQRGNDPLPLPTDWTPSNECVVALLRLGIPQTFLDDALRSFAIFWRDAGTAHRSWNAKFIEHAQYIWRSQPQAQPTAFDRLTDRGWADGIVLNNSESNSLEDLQ